MTASAFLGKEQIAFFKAHYCKIANPAEILAAGFDGEEIMPEENFYRLDVVPSLVFRIPGFNTTYNIQSRWQKGQIIHPWWL